MTTPSEDPKFTRKPDGAAPKRGEGFSFRKKIEPKIARKRESKSEDLFDFAKENTQDTVAYIFLVIGFLLFFFAPFYGGIILGILMGLYFTPELVRFWKDTYLWVEKWGMVKTLVLAGIFLSFFVASFGAAVIMVVTVITVILKQIFLPQLLDSSHKNMDEEP